MTLVDAHTLPTREPKPGWHGRFFDSQAMSFAYYQIDAGASLHEHSHPNEEVWHVLSGALEITIGAETHRAGPGAAALVPPNTAHSVRALQTSSVIVVDTPLRGAVGGGGRAALTVALEPAGEDAIKFVIENVGATSALLRRVSIEAAVAATLPAPVRTEITGELPERVPLEAGAVHSGTHWFTTLTAEQRRAVRDAEMVFYVRGVVLYDDAAGECHHTTFCRTLDASGRLVAPASPGYNYGD
jgi:unsaturated pyranuronate lyase